MPADLGVDRNERRFGGPGREWQDRARPGFSGFGTLIHLLFVLSFAWATPPSGLNQQHYRIADGTFVHDDIVLSVRSRSQMVRGQPQNWLEIEVSRESEDRVFLARFYVDPNTLDAVVSPLERTPLRTIGGRYIHAPDFKTEIFEDFPGVWRARWSRGGLFSDESVMAAINVGRWNDQPMFFQYERRVALWRSPTGRHSGPFKTTVTSLACGPLFAR